jgi:hypothetical protein
MPRIVVDCQAGGRWPGQDVDILVDGRDRAKIGRNGRADIAIEAGSHVLQARVGRVMSQPLYFRLLDRETIGFDCIVSGAWTKRVTLAQTYLRLSDERFKAQEPSVADLESDTRVDGS